MAVTDYQIQESLRLALEEMTPKCVYLFGSAAKTPELANDIDLLFIVDNAVASTRDLSRRIRKRIADRGVPVDVVVATESQVKAAKVDVSSVLRHALQEGKCLYGSPPSSSTGEEVA